MQSAMSISQVLGFLCIALNVILIPLAAYYIYRRLKRRKDVLNLFLLTERGIEGKVTRTRPSLSL